ncbi:MAG: hypothetical protein PWP23_2627 [Candidatus Sumerlaeota bacterium]|nr:hypothetical protein [Candidatus Sumerlaeota bacterium]
MNLAPGDTMETGGLTITLQTTIPAEQRGDGVMDKDQVTLRLDKNGSTDTRTVDEGDAFNWQGHHVAIVAVYAKKGDLGFGSTVIEAATVDSLPAEVARSTTANGPEHRLRVKHTLDKLTLHHSATPLNPGDDLAQKLINMQKWGESDRNWWDIPYHFIIALDGSVYEARDYHYVGDTNTRYNPRGHFLINCYGNYMTAEPNEAQLDTIVNLMAWAAAEYGISTDEIYGHGDLAQTSCPGANLQKYIDDGTFKRRVDDVLAKGQPRLQWLETME